MWETAIIACCTVDGTGRDGWELFSHQTDWHFHFCNLCLYNRLFQSEAHLDIRCKMHDPLLVQSATVDCECVRVPVDLSNLDPGLLLRLPPRSCCQWHFLSCSHLLPHNGFSVMIVVFCSGLTHEALGLTKGAHVCCIMMKLLPQVSQRQDGWDSERHSEKERPGLRRCKVERTVKIVKVRQ